MEILGKILGNEARVKIMRLFLLNKNNNFNAKEVAQRSRVGVDVVRRELKLLSSAGFTKKRGTASPEWYYNNSFSYGEDFEKLLVSGESLSSGSIIETFKKVGKIKLLIVSGVFIKNSDSRVDLLIVGDGMKRAKIEEGMRKIEAEMGVELVYAVFETQEFLYRLNMYDKLIRDILDFPHEVLVQAKELSTQALKKA